MKFLDEIGLAKVWGNFKNKIGELTNLKTTNKDNIVNAINEVRIQKNNIVRFNLENNQSIPAETFIPIVYDVKTVVQGEDFVSQDSEGVFTINKAGIYLLQPSVSFATNTTGGRHQDILRINNNAAKGTASGTGAMGVRSSFSSCGILILTEEDINEGNNKIKHRVYQTSGSSLDIYVAGTSLTIINLNKGE